QQPGFQVVLALKFPGVGVVAHQGVLHHVVGVGPVAADAERRREDAVPVGGEHLVHSPLHSDHSFGSTARSLGGNYAALPLLCWKVPSSTIRPGAAKGCVLKKICQKIASRKKISGCGRSRTNPVLLSPKSHPVRFSL